MAQNKDSLMNKIEKDLNELIGKGIKLEDILFSCKNGMRLIENKNKITPYNLGIIVEMKRLDDINILDRYKIEYSYLYGMRKVINQALLFKDLLTEKDDINLNWINSVETKISLFLDDKEKGIKIINIIERINETI